MTIKIVGRKLFGEERRSHSRQRPEGTAQDGPRHRQPHREQEKESALHEQTAYCQVSAFTYLYRYHQTPKNVNRHLMKTT